MIAPHRPGAAPDSSLLQLADLPIRSPAYVEPNLAHY